MTEPITCEARLMGLSKTRRKDGDWVEIKFHIHPDDHPAALFILPLGTDCNLAISGVAESEDDAPDEPYLLEGQILVGEEFIWEPNSPHARAHIIVTRIDDDVIWSRRYAGGDEFWNDKSRFREAAHRHSHSGPPATPDEPVKLRGGKRAKRAGILCNDERFFTWLESQPWVSDIAFGGYWEPSDMVAESVRRKCGVNSRAALDHNDKAGQIWDQIEAEFHSAQHGETTEAFEVMKGEGPE